MENIKQIVSTFNSDYFFSDPTEGKYTTFILVFFILILALSVFIRILLPIKIEKKDPRWGLWKTTFWALLIFSLVGFFLILFRMQDLPVLSKRILVYIDFGFIIMYAIGAYIYLKRTLPKKLLSFKNQKRKEKWLPKKR